MKISFKAVDNMDQKIISRILDIERKAFGNGALDEYVVVPLMRHGKVYIAVDEEDTAVASAYFLRDMNDIDLCYLMSVAVLPELRGYDVGIALIEYALEGLTSYGLTRIQLTVDPANFKALSAYREKLGFTVADTSTDEYGTGDDKLIMTREL